MPRVRAKSRSKRWQRARTDHRSASASSFGVCVKTEFGCNERQMPLPCRAPHFGFGAQSVLVVPPAVMVEPVTPPPMAMAPQFAWMLAGVGSGDFASGDFREGRDRQKPPKVLSQQRRARLRATPEPAGCSCHAGTPIAHLGL